MEVKLVTRERTIPARLPYPTATFVEVDFPCSGCGSKQVAGGTPTRGHDTYTAPAVCVDCRAACGTLVATVSTLFGIEEDERVLNGRPRVY
jgi:hypothetical protein